MRTPLLLLIPLALVACRSMPPISEVLAGREPAEGAEARAGEAIVLCGLRHDIGTPVVLWDDPGGYDAYRTDLHFGGEERLDRPRGLRYTPGRDPLERRPRFQQPPREIAELVDLFVVHYDVCGTSRRCFEVLHDRRGLSVHFLLDVDGTLYQTLDLADTAWHARQVNPRSVGVEIANIGAWPPEEAQILERWYAKDGAGARLSIPAELKAGLRRPDFTGRPARAEPVRGRAQGALLVQYDFTPEQYRALAKLAAGLCRVLPRIEPEAPRGAAGRVRDGVLSEAEQLAFSGIVGHLHTSAGKVDPGPAFDWEGFLAEVRQLLGAESPP